MTIETKQRANATIYALTAEDVMDRNCLIIPQQMLVREAARLLHRKRSHVAAVVDENGRCVGMLRAADVFRWIDADCPKAVVGAPVTCPYQVQGRLLNGDEALICTFSHGSCGFKTEIPTTGGRHTDVCVRQETADLPFGAPPRSMTTDFVSISSRSNLSEMVRQIVDSRADGLIVLDKSDRPAGIVSATDILIAIVERMRELAKTRKERIAARKPK
jgi:CBS domain-containing protein